MIIDSRILIDNSVFHTDIVILGGGAAGTLLSLYLAKQGIKSVIIEGGDFDYSDLSQDLYEGSSLGDYHLPHGLRDSRIRMLGGSTNCWAGGVTELDRFDFKRRSWIENSGWPFELETLQPHYTEASKFLGKNINDIRMPSKNGRLPNITGFVTKSLEYVDMLPFQLEFEEEFKKSNFIKVFTNANFDKFEFTDNLIDGIVFSQNLENVAEVKRVKVSGKKFVICCGGIESTRILLNSDRQNNFLLQNKEPLGRYFCDHPIAPAATIISESDTNIINKYLAQPYWEKATEPYFSLPYDVQKKYSLLNCALQFYEEQMPFTDSDIAAYEVYSWLKGRSSKVPQTEQVLKLLKNPLDIFNTFRERKSGSKKRISVRFQLENAPLKNSVLKLGKEVDKMGHNKIELYWNIGVQARHTLDVNLAGLSDFLQRKNLGTLKLDPQLRDSPDKLPKDLRGGQHHCGSIRMGLNDNTSVVNENLRLHSKKNLYVCSSAVFPTNSWANPTFTILALAHRLSVNLHKNMFENI